MATATSTATATATADEYQGLRPIKKGGRFECPWKKWERPGFYNLGKWKFFTHDNSNVPKDKAKLDEVLPVENIDNYREKLAAPPSDKVQVMWIGHATVLVQFDGITILADPVFSDVCGPVNQGRLEQWGIFGYKRFRPASCRVEDIPKLDAVLISHDHYDHLDKPSVKDLNKKFKDLQWYVGKGLKRFFTERGCRDENVHEMTWWDTKEHDGVKFVCTPAQHWCMRGVMDENKCLWCSWVVKGPTKSFFFAGDTGYYEPLFKKIGEKFGPFDLAALPIGAYEPRCITEYQHVNPEEAVKIHTDIKSEASVGIHWGTLVMTNEFYVEPPQKLQEEMSKARIKHESDEATAERLKPKRFQCLYHGELWVVGEEREEPTFMFEPNPTPTPTKL